MNAGQVAAIVVLIGGFYFIRKYVKKRTEREVKTIDNISYPEYDTRNRSTASTRSSKTSGATKHNGVKGKTKEGRGIPIPKNSSGARGEQTARRNSKTIELHKPTTL